MLIDLQIHSTHSDGYLTPGKLASFIAKQGVKIASLTDHCTISGQEEFKTSCAKYKIKTIPGLELYTKVGRRKIDILWYNYNENSPELNAILSEIQKRRRRNIKNKLIKLQKTGFKLNIETILEKHNNYIPINKIADELISSPFNKRKVKKDLGTDKPREEDLMAQYFFNKKSEPLNEAYIDLNRIIKIKKKIGGQLIFCHPDHNHKMHGDIIPKLKKIGLDGLEILSPHHSYGSVMYIQYLAKKFNFITTGGSDFHRFELSDKKLKYSWQYFKIDSKFLINIDKIIGK